VVLIVNCSKSEILFLLFFIFLNALYLQGSAAAAATNTHKNIEITSGVSLSLKTEPGETITIPLKVSNTSSNTLEFIEELKLPPGWTLILKPAPFTLNPYQTEVRLFTFLVPHYCLAGDYTVSCQLRDISTDPNNPTDPTDSTPDSNPNNPKKIAQKTFQIKILPTYQVEIIPHEQNPSPYVLAGEEYNTEFTIINRGNTPQKISLTATDSEKFTLSIHENSFSLLPGESRIIQLKIKIPLTLNLINAKEDNITLVATINDKNGEDISFYHYDKVQLIPQICGNPDIYHRIPSSLSLTYQQGGNLDINIHGNGHLKDAGNADIIYALHLLQPLSFLDDPSTNNIDYSMCFTNEENEAYTFTLGKFNTGISPLLKKDVFEQGMGIGGSWKNEKYHITALYANTEHTEIDQHEPIEKGYIISLGGEPFDDGWEFNLTYLNNQLIAGNRGITPEMTDILSLGIKKKDLFHQLFSSDKNPFKNTNLELEYARANIDRQEPSAFRGRITGQFYSFDYTFSTLVAEPDYSGKLNDVSIQNIALSKKFGENFSLGWQYQNKNKISTPDMKQSNNFILHYQLPNNRLFLFYQNLVEEDLFHKKNQDLYQLYYSYQQEKIHFQTYYQLKYIDDQQNNNREEDYKFYLSVDYSPATQQTYHLSYFSESNPFLNSYQHKELQFSTQYPLKDRDNILAYCSINQQEFSTTNLNLNLSCQHEFTNGFNLELGQNCSFNQDADFTQEELSVSLTPYIGATYEHQFSNGGTLSLKGQYSFFGKTPLAGINSLEIAYQVPFGLPLGPKKNIGKIKGKIYNTEDPQLYGIKGVLVKLNHFSTLTDDQGYFLFQGLESGDYILQVDYASIPENSISVRKMPLKLKIEQGEEQTVNIGLCRKVLFQGDIIKYDYPPGELTATTSLIQTTGIGQVNLQLINKDSGEIRRCITDREGHFIFPGLPPGQWSFLIIGLHLPAFYYIDHYPKEFILKAGDVQKVKIKILPRKRIIKMIENKKDVLKLSEPVSNNKK